MHASQATEKELYNKTSTLPVQSDQYSTSSTRALPLLHLPCFPTAPPPSFGFLRLSAGSCRLHSDIFFCRRYLHPSVFPEILCHPPVSSGPVLAVLRHFTGFPLVSVAFLRLSASLQLVWCVLRLRFVGVHLTLASHGLHRFPMSARTISGFPLTFRRVVFRCLWSCFRQGWRGSYKY